jgi:hypothetical protein
MIEVKKIPELVPGDLLYIYNNVCLLFSKSSKTTKASIPGYQWTTHELTCLWPTTLVNTTSHSENDILVLK